MEPLKNVQVWRFSLFYFFVFGAFVALSLWLPQYLINVYGLDIRVAGAIAANFSVPASIFRPYEGRLADVYGARKVMYWSLLVGAAATFILSYPPTDYVVHGAKGVASFHLEMGVIPFTITALVLGFFMALGKAAVYKQIPVYYPDHVGPVGGLVGMIGGLGGFVLPILYGVLLDLTGLWTSCFMALFVLVTTALVWMHFAIRQMEREAAGPALEALPALPELQGSRPRSPLRSATGCLLTGDLRTRPFGLRRAGGLRAATSGSRSRRCFFPSPYGRCGRWWWRSCRRRASNSRPMSSFGSPRSRVFPARRCASSIPSWSRSSADGCGRRSPPGRC